MAQPSSRLSLSFKIGDQPVPGYRLVRELGRGTFGVVWLAVTENGFERALKVVNLEQKGGKKEFRALRLIKDRKILHGNLLTLIDYWLLDRDGTILASPANVNLDTQVAPKTSSASASEVKAAPESMHQPVIDRAAVLKGTMIPGAGGFESTAVNSRDTHQQSRLTDTTEDESSSAIWLVVAMELGHKTLHDRQKEHGHEQPTKSSRAMRHGATQVDKKGDTAAGSHTAANAKADQHASAEDEVLASLPADEVLPYMEQAARGLDYLHRCEIVHRDVKPQNIMLVGDVAKVCDYGLASELGDMRATTNAFTLPYAAPDAINNRPVPASDQYSLAVTYIELRTGRWPFVSNTSTAVYAAKETGVHYLKFVSKRAVRVVLKKALSKNPADRFPTCGEFVKQLAKAEHSRSNVFAAVQVVLACIAIFTVLAAAAATHPDIRAQALAYLDQFRSTDVAEFARRVKVAEGMLADNKPEAAAAEFESLRRQLPLLPATASNLRYDAILGFARAQAGMKDPLADGPAQTLVRERLADLPVQPDPPLDERQSLLLYYLQVITKQNPLAISGLDPDHRLAQSTLGNWERALWAKALQSPGITPGTERIPPNLQEALKTIVAQRKSADSAESFATAKDGFEQMVRDARESLPENDDFWHAIKLEELHLALKNPDPNHEQNLRSLDALLVDRLKHDRQLVIRGQLLRLLILANLKQPQPSFFDPAITATVAATEGALTSLQETTDSPFSVPEINALKDLHLVFKSEVRDASQPIPEEAFPAVVSLCGKRDAFGLLRQRVRKHLDDKSLADNQVPAIQTAWLDLAKFVGSDFKLDSSEKVEMADLGLSVAFADPQAKPADVLRDFLPQVRESRQGAKWMKVLLDRASRDSTWLEVSLPALKSLSNEPTDDLAVSNDFVRLRSEANTLTLAGILNIDPATPEAASQILARLDSAADQAHPLPTLARIECEFVAAAQPTSEQHKAWLARLRNALDRVDSNNASLLAYGQFVHSRLLARSEMAFEREESGKLLIELLHQASLPSWLTPSRKQAAGEMLGAVALAQLNVNDSDVLQFHLLNLTEQKQLAEIQAVVSKAGLQSNSLLAVSTIVESTHSDKTDWKQVREWARRCQQDPRTVALLQSQGRLRLVEYVEALSALRLAPADTELAAETILGFQRLLYARDGKTARYFQFDGPPTADDDGIFRNLVIPIVSHDSFKAKTIAAAEAKSALGALWAAKGRLLQRSGTVVVHDPLRKLDTRDTTTVSLVLAHDAFRRARELQPDQIDYVVGFGRTLTELPSTDTDPEKRAEAIAALVDKYDREGVSPNLGMLALGGYVRRFQARAQGTREQQELLANDAIRRYRMVLDGTKHGDPLQLRSVCLEGLSDAHLRFAFWTSKITSHEVAKLIAQETPPADSKAYHLREASANALEAVRMTERNQKENAHNALGNAYEDMAFYLGMSEYYQQSIDTFETGIRAAEEDERIAARAKMHLGRCLCRYGRDFLSGLSDKKREEMLERARISLTESLEEARDRNNLRAETYFWRATSSSTLALYQPDKAEELLRQAESDLSEAKDISRGTHNLSEANYYQFEQIRIAIVLHQDTDNPVQKAAALQRAQNATNEMYERAAVDPKWFSVTTLSQLVSQSRQTFPTDGAKLQRWLPANGPLYQQWRSSDAFRGEAVKQYLMTALAFKRQADENEAISIVRSIEDPQLKAVANAAVLAYQADQQFRALEAHEERYRRLKLQPNADQAKLKADAQAESQKAYDKLRAAYDAHLATFDTDATALFNEINRTSLDQIRAGKFKRRTSVERRQVLNQVTGPALGVRERLYSLAYGLAQANSEEKNPEFERDLTRVAHDCLKPLFFLNEGDFNEPNRSIIARTKEKYGRQLETRERELVKLGDKFD